MARQMKDSGVEWMGEIPCAWDTQKIKFLFAIKKRIAGKEGYTVLSITQKGIVPKNLDSNEGQMAQNYSNYQLVHVGDFAMNHMDLLTGWVDISPYEGVTSPDYRVFVANNQDLVNPRFYLYLFQNCYANRIFYGMGQGVSGLGRWRLPAEQFLNFRIPYPSANEQLNISSILDTKCAEINKVVEQTRATIEEYKRLKQAIITEAVTKGVRGARTMKPSGVEWIGDIPEEWEVRKVSQFWKANKGPNAAQLTAEYCGNHPGEYPVYSGQTENNGVMGMIDSYSFDFGERGCLFSTTVGAKAMTVSCLYNKFSLSQNCMIMQPLSEKCDVRYYFYLFTFIFGYFRSLIPDYMQPSFRVKDFLSYFMMLPSVIEQQEIAANLDTKCAEIDHIIEKKEQLIEELGRYKKSLIYEYVTGKKEVTQK